MEQKIINTIINDKWENAITLLPDNYVDIIITSPPYNVNLGKNKHKKDTYDNYEDNMPYNEYLEWMDLLFSQCYRVLKPGARICVNIGDGCNGSVPTHADFTVRMRDKHGFKMMTTIVWDKGQIGSRTAWGSYMSPSQPSFPTPFEFIIVMAKETLKHEGDKSNITVSGKEFQDNSISLWKIKPETQMMSKYGHPAMFPENLVRKLLQQLTYADDIVLDPFSGCGTTCAVAKMLKRRYIGFEMSQRYWETSLRRLDECNSLFENL